METEDLKNLSRQLSCPTGEDGIMLGYKMNETNEFIINRSINALAPKEGDNILEIGFGNGLLSKQIIESIGVSGKYTGIEKSLTLAQQAGNNFRSHNKSNISIHCSDYNEVKIENNSVDGVIAVNLLYFIDDIDLFFQKLYGWLKPGARIIIGIRSSKTLKKMPFTQFYFNLRTGTEIIKSMSHSGLSHIDLQYHDEGVTNFNGMELPVDALIIKAFKK